ncbi:protein-L-isoaspartate O-methyltransferase 1 isoform X2 [Physcomitrium patens]|uniref:protein-L-isoaspartate O-methyltransferase 1 isoform X2 n=1 Tax=Physcomitrium patens TaxID=3218 RepID=UPI003CCD5E76
MPAMSLVAGGRNGGEQVQCGGPIKGCGKPLPRVGRKSACAAPGTYPPAPTCPGDAMQWHCHGANYEELVSNLQNRGILTSLDAAAAMSKVDRKLFVPTTGFAYNDVPQVIGYGATISAPHMVGETGRVIGVEHIQELAERSIDAIKETPAGELMDKGRIVVHVADGKLGNEEGAPYDCIHVGAAAPELPEALVQQLKPGGRMVIPLGTDNQDLVIIDKLPDGSIKKTIEMVVRYVPLI